VGERPKLNLQPRTSTAPLNAPAVLTKADPFGGAKPVDTAKVIDEKFARYKQLTQKSAAAKPEDGEAAEAEVADPGTPPPVAAKTEAPVSKPPSREPREPREGSGSSERHTSEWKPRGRGEGSSFKSWRGDSRRGDDRRGDDRRYNDRRHHADDSRRRQHTEEHKPGEFRSARGPAPKPAAAQPAQERKAETTEARNPFDALNEDLA
jgi:hypothetical protein